MVVNIELLKKEIETSGLSMVFIAQKAGILRETLYNRLNGIGEFTASEIVGLSYVLRLKKATREAIFFSQNVEFNSTSDNCSDEAAEPDDGEE